jgi:hypothetical protein
MIAVAKTPGCYGSVPHNAQATSRDAAKNLMQKPAIQLYASGDRRTVVSADFICILTTQ